MPGLIRNGIYKIEDVLPFTGNYVKLYNNHKVKMYSQRYTVFKKKGVVCKKCGLVGEYFALEAHNCKNMLKHGFYHFNLYGTKNGKEVLFTKDHVFPKSEGGTNNLKNLQVLCQPCNSKKGSIVSIVDFILNGGVYEYQYLKYFNN